MVIIPVLSNKDYDGGKRVDNTVRRYKRDLKNVKTRIDVKTKSILSLKGKIKRLEAEIIRQEEERSKLQENKGALTAIIGMMEGMKKPNIKK